MSNNEFFCKNFHFFEEFLLQIWYYIFKLKQIGKIFLYDE